MWPFGIGPWELLLAIGVAALLWSAGRARAYPRKAGYCYLAILGLVLVYAIIRTIPIIPLIR